MLALTSVYVSESGLFNGLRAIQTRKTAPAPLRLYFAPQNRLDHRPPRRSAALLEALEALGVGGDRILFSVIAGLDPWLDPAIQENTAPSF